MAILRIAGLLFMVTLICCKSSTDIVFEGAEEKKIIEQELIQRGYEKATVLKTMDSTSCPFILRLENDTKPYTINLKDQYREEELELWIKYRRLRMPQRCEAASPVELTEIKSL